MTRARATQILLFVCLLGVPAGAQIAPPASAAEPIDYDAMYLPALANAPAYEAGHPNYQHPTRTERSYSPDLDRFPLLVVATALKALAVRGPALWKRYDNGNNLLFTADDFQNPASSALMRELWQSGNPALRVLVGKLALACTQPLPETPWLDELVPGGASAELTDFVIDPGKSVLTGKVTVDGEVAVESAPL